MTWNDSFTKNKRLYYFILILLFAVGYAYYGCFSYLAFPDNFSGQQPISAKFLFMVFHEILCIALLSLVLAERGETFSNLGVSFERKDLFHSFGLFFGSLVVQFVLLWGYMFVMWCITGDFNFKSFMDTDSAESFLIAISKTPIYLLGIVTLVNPFFEEIIVRAFFMTEFNRFVKSGLLAVLSSTLIQTGYHFYQGWTYTVVHFLTFLFFSIYYQKTKRATPLILAHFYLDVIGIFRTVI